MATTIAEKQQRSLLKKFHTLLGKTGGGEVAKAAILESYGVASSRDLSAAQLLEVCSRLERDANPELAELDKLRKRLLAAVFGFFRAQGRQASMTEAKAVACRAAGSSSFNAISKDRLRSLYGAFNRRIKDIEAVARIVPKELLERKEWN